VIGREGGLQWTLIVLIPVDFLFLGVVAKGFFTSQVGDMPGEIRLALICFMSPAFSFVSAPAKATWHSTLLYGALFGLFLLCDLRPDIAGAAKCPARAKATPFFERLSPGISSKRSSAGYFGCGTIRM
jgi:hypothetical protein